MALLLDTMLSVNSFSVTQFPHHLPVELGILSLMGLRADPPEVLKISYLASGAPEGDGGVRAPELHIFISEGSWCYSKKARSGKNYQAIPRNSTFFSTRLPLPCTTLKTHYNDIDQYALTSAPDSTLLALRILSIHGAIINDLTLRSQDWLLHAVIRDVPPELAEQYFNASEVFSRLENSDLVHAAALKSHRWRRRALELLREPRPDGPFFKEWPRGSYLDALISYMGPHHEYLLPADMIIADMGREGALESALVSSQGPLLMAVTKALNSTGPFPTIRFELLDMLCLADPKAPQSRVEAIAHLAGLIDKEELAIAISIALGERRCNTPSASAARRFAKSHDALYALCVAAGTAHANPDRLAVRGSTEGVAVDLLFVLRAESQHISISSCQDGLGILILLYRKYFQTVYAPDILETHERSYGPPAPDEKLAVLLEGCRRDVVKMLSWYGLPPEAAPNYIDTGALLQDCDTQPHSRDRRYR